MNTASKKVLLVGNAKRGKTVWAANATHSPLPQSYLPTQGAKVHTLTFPAHSSRIMLWDLAGRSLYRCLGDAYYIDADVALIFGDNTEEICLWADEVRRVAPNATLIALVRSTYFATIHNLISSTYNITILNKSETDSTSLLKSLLKK